MDSVDNHHRHNNLTAALKNAKAILSHGLAEEESSMASALNQNQPPAPLLLGTHEILIQNSRDRQSRTPLPSQHTPHSALDAIKALKKDCIPGLGRKFLWKVLHEVCIILSY